MDRDVEQDGFQLVELLLEVFAEGDPRRVVYGGDELWAIPELDEVEASRLQLGQKRVHPTEPRLVPALVRKTEDLVENPDHCAAPGELAENGKGNADRSVGGRRLGRGLDLLLGHDTDDIPPGT